jgi:hypothetical protein
VRRGRGLDVAVGRPNSGAMAIKLNQPGFEQAQELIAARRFAIDDRDAWSAHRPSPRDATEFIAAHGWDAYGRWHLAVEDALPARTKPHYRFPYGDFRDVHRCAIRSADHDAIRGAARFLDELLETARARTASSRA